MPYDAPKYRGDPELKAREDELVGVMIRRLYASIAVEALPGPLMELLHRLEEKTEKHD